MKRFTSIILSVFLVWQFCGVQLAAAEKSASSSESIAEKESALEKKYSINIKYTSSADKPNITLDSLVILDMALENVTPEFIKELSNYYKEKHGSKLTFSYVQEPSISKASGEIILAAFDPERSLIEIYFPRSSGNTMITGESPYSIVHELGHAFHLMYTDKYGFDKMNKEWSAFNGSIKYDPSHLLENPNEKAFITGYAATMFEEDVAETFAHTFIRNRAGQGFKNRLTNAEGKDTNLGKKVKYIESMLSKYIKNSDQAVANYQRIYKTATSTTYNGMKFSGEHMQFAGYPQPRFILKGILKVLDKEKNNAIWIRSIGAWYVKDTNGKESLVFPGGVHSKVSDAFTPPKAAA